MACVKPNISKKVSPAKVFAGDFVVVADFLSSVVLSHQPLTQGVLTGGKSHCVQDAKKGWLWQFLTS